MVHLSSRSSRVANGPRTTWVSLGREGEREREREEGEREKEGEREREREREKEGGEDLVSV